VIGLLVVQLVRRAGAGQIVAVDGIEHRRALAGRLGADLTMKPGPDVAARVRELTDNRGADKVIEVSGAPPALNEAIRTAGAGGLVVAMSWYGGTFESLTLSGEFHHNRVRVHSSQVAAVNPDLGPLWDVRRRCAVALRLLNELLLDPLITHEYPVQRAAEAYRTVDGGDPELVQAIITYRSGE
jgi:threonine dehydrogenase-like Zn-dependent dehydrogenase